MRWILTIIITILVIFILIFLTGVISAAFLGRKKNRRAHAIVLLSQLTKELIEKMIDILLAHRTNNMEKINSIMSALGSDTLNQLLKLLRPENRPKNFSSGKFGDNLSWTAMEKALQDQDYTINSSKIVTGIILHNLDVVLMEMDNKNRKRTM